MRSSFIALAALAVAAASPTGLPGGWAPSPTKQQRRRTEHERQQAYQKMLSADKLSEEQRAWNDAVDARRMAKLTAANLKARTP